MNDGAIRYRDAGTDHHERFDGDVLAELRVGSEVDRIGRNHGDASLKRRLAQARLHHLLGFGQLGLGVDAAHFVLAGFDHNRLQSQIPDDANRIGQIILALAVGTADFFDHRQRLAPVESHDAGVAKSDRTFLRSCVSLLSNPVSRFPLTSSRPYPVGSVARNPRTASAAPWSSAARSRWSVRGGYQWRIAEHDEQVISAAGDGIACRQNGVGGAEPLTLNERGGIRTHTFDFCRDRLVLRPDHHGQCCVSTLWGGVQNMRQQRLSGQRMQHLGHGGPHARALTRGEHDRKAGPKGHPNPLLPPGVFGRSHRGFWRLMETRLLSSGPPI